MLTPDADPVRKVSIITRGMALGVALAAPDDDQVSYTLEDLLAMVQVTVAGRVAAESVTGRCCRVRARPPRPPSSS